jgi:hypothetical protein
MLGDVAETSGMGIRNNWFDELFNCRLIRWTGGPLFSFGRVCSWLLAGRGRERLQPCSSIRNRLSE